MSLRAAIIGPGRRARYYYAPLLNRLKDEVELAAVWGRNPESAKKFGEDFNIPWYTDMEKMKKECGIDIAIVVVNGPNNSANGPVGLMAVEHGFNVLLETPIAYRLNEADAIINSAKRQNLKIEVSEQFHLRPHMQLILKILETGIFGKVHSSFNDFAGHGYHGVSVMRAFLGFNLKPLRVFGACREYEIKNSRKEIQEHGIIEFEEGKLGIYHWTNGGYHDPLRWWRSGRFLAENGMGVSSFRAADYSINLTLLEKDGAAPRPISIEKRLERVDGGNLQYLAARTGDDNHHLIRWDNPFASPAGGQGYTWEDDQIGVASCIMNLVNAVKNNTEVPYGPHQARLDQEITLAIKKSSALGMPVMLPLDPDEVIE